MRVDAVMAGKIEEIGAVLFYPWAAYVAHILIPGHKQVLCGRWGDGGKVISRPQGVVVCTACAAKLERQWLKASRGE